MTITPPTLRISEIFYSIQGEAATVGWPTVFVRLTGCPLRCQYCDTAYAFHGGTKLALSEIVLQVQRFQTRYVTVTGGEPLAQKFCLNLLQMLCDLDYSVSLETSGALPIAGVDLRVSRVVDVKTPGSGEVQRNLWENLACLTANDQVKLVICDHADYVWAKEIVTRYELTKRCLVLFSPSYQQLALCDLADWILADGLQVRLQSQLHKTIWGELPGK